MISKKINKIIPNEITYLIVDYIRPDKLDINIQNEIKSEFVYRLFKQIYNEFIEKENIMNENKNREFPLSPFIFEYLVDMLPHEEYDNYIKCLKNHKNKDECYFYIEAIKNVKKWDEEKSFYTNFHENDIYDDEEEYIRSHFQPIFADHGECYLYSGYDSDYYDKQTGEYDHDQAYIRSLYLNIENDT